MSKSMLIDAAHPEETRVVVLDGHRVDDFDFETQNKKQLRGNIYLAKVTRVEPSLQAAFVEYGGNRHGFLAFGEIHPDYYSIPVADREALKAEFEAAASEDENGGDEEEGDDEDNALEERRRRILMRRYKIQEVIKRRQIMLVQVVKEERGNKGAALTTYLSLAGRYCVLMPNTGRGGGISRKITNSTDRKRLKKIATDLDVPGGMGLIIRTAGAKRTKTEIKRDYEYLLRAWETIRDTTMRSVAPVLIYEESSLVKRAIRDLYDKDVEDIYVEGDAAYKEAKDFVRMLMPSHAKKVHLYKEATPIFTRHGVERQLETIYSPVVTLRSGGYIVINQTEALVAIDVNSGKATRERNIEQTALKTNLEAADEAARQMRLRDLAGLVVIDFIDMEDPKNDRVVEKRVKESLRFDRARVQMGKISPFGLLELSRQRRRTGILEGSSHVCPVCSGLGRVRSVESSALRLLRALDEECIKRPDTEIQVRAPAEVALYLLNEKRATLAAIEDNRRVRIRVAASAVLLAPDFEISATGVRETFVDAEDEATPEAAEPSRGPALRGRKDRDRVATEAAPEAADVDEDAVGPEESERGESGRRRRRGRRGGKRGRESDAPIVSAAGHAEDFEPEDGSQSPLDSMEEKGGRRRRRRRGRSRRTFEHDGGEHLDMVATNPARLFVTVAVAEAPVPEIAPKLVEEIAPTESDLADEVEGDRSFEEAPVSTTPAEAVAATPTEEQAEVAPEPDSEQDDPASYEPDLQRREKFFARLSRWGKKA